MAAEPIGTTALSALTGISFRQLDHVRRPRYGRAALVVPTQPADGSGTQALWALADAVAAVVAQAVRNVGPHPSFLAYDAVAAAYRGDATWTARAGVLELRVDLDAVRYDLAERWPSV